MGFSQLQDVQQNLVSIKQGSSIVLTASSSHASFFQWFNNGVAIQNETNASYRVTQSGIYTVVAFNNINCSSDVSKPITVVVEAEPIQIANINIIKSAENKPVTVNDDFYYTISVRNDGPDDATNVLVKDTLTKELALKEITSIPGVNSSFSTQSRTVTWQIDTLRANERIELKLIAKSLYPGQLKNTVYVSANQADTNESDNSSTALKEVFGIKIPNVFTPNNDDKNETFFIAGLDAYPDNEITILNRWGNHVYERKPYNNDWTGDRLNDGTYFYVLRIKTSDNKQEVFKGFITLIRKKQ